MNRVTSANGALSKQAIFLGVLTDIIGSTLLGFLIGFFLGFILGFGGNSSADIVSIGKLPVVQGILFCIGACMTALGGFVSGVWAKYRVEAHALWSGVIVEAIGILTSAIPLVSLYVSHPEAVETGAAIRTFLALIVTIPAAYTGGMLAKRYLQRKRSTVRAAGAI